MLHNAEHRRMRRNVNKKKTTFWKLDLPLLGPWITGLMLAISKGFNRVGVPPHMKTKTESVFRAVWFIVISIFERWTKPRNSDFVHSFYSFDFPSSSNHCSFFPFSSLSFSTSFFLSFFLSTYWLFARECHVLKLRAWFLYDAMCPSALYQTWCPVCLWPWLRTTAPALDWVATVVDYPWHVSSWW
jgi:hypothetical protein